MTFYHGTTRPGLTELTPHASPGSNRKEPLVYLTTNRQLALHYIWDEPRLGFKMPMLNVRPDGVLVFQEMFSGALEYLYKGVSGYIYHCEGDYSIDPTAGVPFCAMAAEPVPVTGCEYIDDAYRHIVSYAQQGTFIYERFEDLPQWRHDLIRGHVYRFIKRCNLLGSPNHPSYDLIHEKFPRYWQEAEALASHGLL